MNFVLSLALLFMLPLLSYSVKNLNNFIQISVKNTAINSMPLSTQDIHKLS